MTEAAEVCLGDIYHLDPEARALRLFFAPVTTTTLTGQKAPPTIAEGSDVGVPGDAIALISRLTLMAPDGDTVELLILRHTGAGGRCRALRAAAVADGAATAITR